MTHRYNGQSVLRPPKAAEKPKAEMNGSVKAGTGPIMKVLYGSNSGSSNLTGKFWATVELVIQL